jgi:hypothetical protein
MKTRRLITVVVVAIAIAALAATAFATVGTLTLTASKSVVKYPGTAKLTVTTPVALESTITIQARRVGGDWSDIKSIPATRAALGTTFTVTPKLAVTSGFKAVQDGLESEVVTISVKASLNSLQINHKKRHVWLVKGSIMPAHAKGTPVTIKVWQKTVAGKGKHRVTTLTPRDDLTALVYKSKGHTSWFSVKFSPAVRGTYVFQAVHSDAGHVESFSKQKTHKFKTK